MCTILCLFGPPGSGKSTIASKVARATKGIQIEFDDLIPTHILTKLQRGTPASDEDRSLAMKHGITHTRSLIARNRGTRIVISCGLRTAPMRSQFLAAFPGARLVFLDVDDQIRNRRMLGREADGHLLTTEVRQRLEKMPERRFEAIEEPHDRIDASGSVDEVTHAVLALISE